MNARHALQHAIKQYLTHAPEQGEWEWEEHCDGLAIGLIDYLPPELLAAYAIETGALVETGIDRDGVPYDLITDLNLSTNTPLYRVQITFPPTNKSMRKATA